MGKRILIVDDYSAAATSLSMLLELLGHQTRVAADGMEALSAVDAFTPDFVLLDIGLPKLNGFAVCEAIRKLPQGRGITLIAVSGRNEDGDQPQAAQAGFDHYLVKPVDIEALKDLLA